MEKIKILIVEDEVFIAKDISLRLESMGYQITGMAATTEEAIVELNRQTPDLCIIDIQLILRLDPGIDSSTNYLVLSH